MTIEEKLQDFMVNELQCSRDVLAHDYPLIENHVVDSLGLLQIVSYIEGDFGVEVQDEELVPEHFETISAIARFVESKREQAVRG